MSDCVDTNRTVKDVLIDILPVSLLTLNLWLNRWSTWGAPCTVWIDWCLHDKVGSSKDHWCGGPSGLDAASWRRLFTSFKSACNDLWHSLAITAQRLPISYCPPSGLSPDCLEQELGCMLSWDWGHCKTDHCQSHLDHYQSGHPGSSWFIATQCWSNFWNWGCGTCRRFVIPMRGDRGYSAGGRQQCV